KVPALTLSAPVNVFRLDKRIMPVPDFVSAPEPLMETGTERSGLPDRLEVPLPTLNVTVPPPDVSATPRGDVIFDVVVPVTVTVAPSMNVKLGPLPVGVPKILPPWSVTLPR